SLVTARAIALSDFGSPDGIEPPPLSSAVPSASASAASPPAPPSASAKVAPPSAPAPSASVSASASAGAASAPPPSTPPPSSSGAAYYGGAPDTDASIWVNYPFVDGYTLPSSSRVAASATKDYRFQKHKTGPSPEAIGATAVVVTGSGLLVAAALDRQGSMN